MKYFSETAYDIFSKTIFVLYNTKEAPSLRLLCITLGMVGIQIKENGFLLYGYYYAM